MPRVKVLQLVGLRSMAGVCCRAVVGGLWFDFSSAFFNFHWTPSVLATPRDHFQRWTNPDWNRLESNNSALRVLKPFCHCKFGCSGVCVQPFLFHHADERDCWRALFRQ